MAVYASKDGAKLCGRLGVTQSMGAVGASADDALAESFNATLKREVLHDENCCQKEVACRREVFRWLTRCDTRRRHSWCRYRSPVDFETDIAATFPSAAESHPLSKNRRVVTAPPHRHAHLSARSRRVDMRRSVRM